jgi:hypothetical protein
VTSGLSNVVDHGQQIAARSVPVVLASDQTTIPVSIAGASAVGSDGSGSITTGGTAQNLFGGVTPTNGFGLYNPDATNDLWMSLSTTAVANGTGSVRIQANRGWYETPVTMVPFGPISVVGTATGQKFTAVKW